MKLRNNNHSFVIVKPEFHKMLLSCVIIARLNRLLGPDIASLATSERA